MPEYIIQIILVIIPGLMAHAQEDCNSRFVNKESVSFFSIEELSDEFKRLKTQDGPCNGKWGSRFHLIMQQLGKRLSKESTDKREVLKWMGPPDSQSDTIGAVKLKFDEEILVYHWRGWHDWLYFVIDNNQVTDCQWWFTYE